MEKLKMDRKFRIGVVGCGVMTRYSHAPGLKNIENVAEVTAVCDLQPNRIEEFIQALDAKNANEIRRCTDYRDMVDVVDCVLIITPHHLHYEQSMFFLQHDIHVFCEKPIANTEEHCLALTAEAKKRKLTFMCAYPIPYYRGVQKLKELLDSGKYGKIFQMSIWTEQYTGPGVWEDRYQWFSDAKKLGGGQLFSHGCHYIDWLLRFLGEPIEGFHMGTNKCVEWLEREGTSNVCIKFENNVMAYHFGTWGARGTTHDYTIHVFTDKGFFDYDFVKDVLTYKSTEGPVNETRGIETWDFAKTGDKRTELEIMHFLNCIETGKEPVTDGDSAIQSLRVIWRLYEAEEKGQIADLRGLGISKDKKNILGNWVEDRELVSPEKLAIKH